MSDKNYTSYYGVTDLYINGEIVAPMEPILFDDVLKVSNCQRLMFENISVHAEGARENALDVNNNSKDISFHSSIFYGGKQSSIVCKGASRLMINRCIIEADPASSVDILVDDYSDQSKLPSDILIKDTVRSDGKPVRIAFGRYRYPRIISTPHEICWFRTIGMHLYNHGKDLYAWLFNVKQSG